MVAVKTSIARALFASTFEAPSSILLRADGGGPGHRVIRRENSPRNARARECRGG